MSIDINGATILRQPEVIEALQKSVKKYFGEDTDVSDEAIFGQFIGVFSEVISVVYEEILNAVLSNNPITADGVWFDYCAAFNLLKRRAATKSVVDVACYGTVNTVIEKGKLFGKTIDSYQFEVNENATISPLNFTRLYLGILGVDVGTEYTLSVYDSFENVDINIVAGPMDTMETITASFLIELDNVLSKAVDLGGGNLLITSKSGAPISITITTIYSLRYGIVCPCTCSVVGAIPVQVETINTIVTPVSGLDSVINLVEGIKGADTETTPEFKIRRDKYLQSLGSSSVEAIVSYIKNNVAGVSVCSGRENDTDLTVDDVPPHSIFMVVGGGDEEEIAAAIWGKKAGGIQTHGNVSVLIQDINGDVQQVRFSRPSTQYAWIRIEIGLYSEEQFPINGIDQIKENVFDYAEQNFKIGLDLIPVRFIPAVLKTEGIQGVRVEVALTDSPFDVPLFSDSPLSINNESFAGFSIDRISVTIV